MNGLPPKFQYPSPEMDLLHILLFPEAIMQPSHLETTSAPMMLRDLVLNAKAVWEIEIAAWGQCAM